MRYFLEIWRGTVLTICCVLGFCVMRTTPAKQSQRPVFLVGTDSAPPYYFLKPDGVIAGVAVDVFKRAASRLDFDLRFVHLTGSPDSFLDSQKVAFWPALTITETRKLKYHMSEPWLFNTFCLLRRTGDPLPLRQAARIAYRTNPVSTATAHKFFPDATYSPRNSRDEVMSAVCRGEVDGGVIEIRVLDSLLLARPKSCESAALIKQAIPGAAYPMGIAALKAYGKQADALQREITRMAETGELAKIFEAGSSISANEANSIVAMNAAEQRTRFACAALFLLFVAGAFALLQFRRVRIAYRIARRENMERKRAEDARRAADSTRNAVLDGAGEGICGLDAQGQTVFINRTAALLLGLDPASVGANDFHALVHHAESGNCCICSSFSDHDQCAASATRFDTVHMRRADGTSFPAEYVLSPLVQDGECTGSVITFKDITARRQADFLDRDRNAVLEMLAQNKDLELIFETIATLAERQFPGFFCAIMTVRDQRLELRAAPSFPGDLRLSLASLEIPLAPAASQPDIAASVDEDALGSTLRDQALASGFACCRSQPIVCGSGNLLGAVVLCGSKAAGRDPAQERLLRIACHLARLAIEQTRLQQKLHHQANHDNLTGFPNRRLFEQRLQESLANARLAETTAALFYIDLDRFKQINDTLSHHVGDLYLCQVATRLYCALPDSATLARLGGDEFGIVIPDIADAATTEQIARDLLDAMSQPFSIDGYALFGTASIGIALSTPQVSAAELQSCADQAMYRAKSLGRNRFQFFSAELSRCAIAQRETEQLLREALEKNQFELYYQPQCRANGELVGFEALIRIRHPERGLISPAQFIAVAEETGLIVPMGAWVLRETCRQIAGWRAQGAPDISVAINVSAAQFAQDDFAKQVSETLEEYSLDPSVLEIELTESMVMGNFDESLAQMSQLRHLGVHLSIDDFGTGYSSLSYLHRLPVQTIKIDQSFVRSMDAEVSTRPLVEAIVAAARSLHCNVIAEGIETDSQRRELVRMGCDHMQGYFFGRPVPPDEALATFAMQLAS